MQCCVAVLLWLFVVVVVVVVVVVLVYFCFRLSGWEVHTYHNPQIHKALPGFFFPLYFQLPYLREETCFQQAGASSAVEGTSQGCRGIF